MRFYGLFYVKNEVSAETSLIFYFYCGSVSRETDEKMSVFFSDFLAQKETDHKKKSEVSS